jgi:diguanylate cyclase (GGDEF)-like protein
MSSRPPNESHRLHRLHATGLVGSPSQERFERVTRLARRLFDVDSATLALLDQDREVHLAHAGRILVERSRERSFSQHVLDGATVLVEDTQLDLRFREHPDARGRRGIRFLALGPIASAEGLVLGALVLADDSPRTLDDDELALFADLVAMATTEVCQPSSSDLDPLTGLRTQHAFSAVADFALASGFRNRLPSTLLLLDLDDLDTLRAAHGTVAASEAVVEASLLLLACFRGSDVLGHLEPQRFAVLLTGATPEQIDIPLARLEAIVVEANAVRDVPWTISFSVGFAGYEPSEHPYIDTLVDDALSAMYDIRIGATG